MRLFEIIRKKYLLLELKKVKAHSGNKYNDWVDNLAKEGKEKKEIIWKEPCSPHWIATSRWKGILIDISLRTFIKEFNKKEINIKWS